VDTLCIVNDDPATKHKQIALMDVIYSIAVFTIAAVSSKDASQAIPGVFEDSRPYAYAKFAPDFALVAFPGPESSSLSWSTHYESRGWTLQERILSQRCLFVFENVVVLQCQQRLFSEHRGITYAKKQKDPEVNSVTQYNPMYPLWLCMIRGERSLFEAARAYCKLVQLYKQRQLSFKSDAVRAFMGITSRLESYIGGASICGIPTALLQYALLWVKMEMDERPPTCGFATWSWASFDGPVLYSPALALLELTMKEDRNDVKRQFELLPISSGKLQTCKDVRPFAQANSKYNRASRSSDPSVWVEAGKHTLHLHSEMVPLAVFILGANTQNLLSDGLMKDITCISISDPNMLPCGVLLGVPPDIDHVSSRFDRVEFMLLSHVKLLEKHSTLTTMGSQMFGTSRSKLFKDALNSIERLWGGDESAFQSVMLIGWRGICAERVCIGFVSARAWKQMRPIRRCVFLV